MQQKKKSQRFCWNRQPTDFGLINAINQDHVFTFNYAHINSYCVKNILLINNTNMNGKVRHKQKMEKKNIKKMFVPK